MVMLGTSGVGDPLFDLGPVGLCVARDPEGDVWSFGTSRPAPGAAG
ncbi:MAG TPA: hypothetical protein VFQ15_03320 [Jiangellaceae bacterium]|nr:hypothetical protein [Jiangellaceae bacterium]